MARPLVSGIMVVYLSCVFCLSGGVRTIVE